jgi:signal transduction histidine kinase
MKSEPTHIVGIVRSGLNLISQAISIHDQDLRLVHGNRRFQELFQIPDDLMRPGTEFRDTLLFVAEQGEYGPVDDIPAFVEDKVNLARQFKPHYFERTRANGSTISIDGSPLEEGGWITVYTDITEIKRQDERMRSKAESLSDELVERSATLAETNRELTATVRALEMARQDLEASRQRLDLINRMTPAHIAHIDAGGRYTHSNGRLSSILPSAERDVVGAEMKKVLGEPVWHHVRPLFDQVMTGSADVTEFRDDASGRFIRLAMTPDVGRRGEVNGAYILSTDVTEEVTARNALTYARRRELATQLTSAMAHDFSNLLTIIMGEHSRLISLDNLDPKVRETADTIQAAAKRGADLVARLNSVSDKMTLDPAAVNVATFLKTLEPLARAALPDGVALHIRNAITDKRLVFDAGFAQDALLNLVINAGEACETTGAVTIDVCRTSDNQLMWTVADNGAGFNAEALDDALNPFYSSKEGKVGRGLGLTSAYDFAKISGGVLKYGNRPEGGAEVSLRIPYMVAAPEENALVLLVDDDDDVRKTVRSYLRRAGHEVTEAASLKEAAQLMAVDGLNMVVTDLDIGGENTGLEVAAEAPAHLAIMCITGLPSTNPLRQKAEQKFPVLSKPFGYDEFAETLKKVTQ